MSLLTTIGLVLFFYYVIKPLIDYYFGDDKKENRSSYDTFEQGMNDSSAILFLFSCMMKADGKMTKNELAAIKKYLLKNNSETEAKKLLLQLKKITQSDHTNDIRLSCVYINQRMNYVQRTDILSTLFQIAVADGTICYQESMLLQQYSRFTRIREIDFARLKGYYTYGFQWEEYKDSRNRHNERQSQNNSTTNTNTYKNKDWALKTLGLTAGASDNEIKKAYRKLALQYHPDKQVGASDKEIQDATKKFQEINEAYNMLTGN